MEKKQFSCQHKTAIYYTTNSKTCNLGMNYVLLENNLQEKLYISL